MPKTHLLFDLQHRVYRHGMKLDFQPTFSESIAKDNQLPHLANSFIFYFEDESFDQCG